jgi:hypothetical protein
MVKWLLDDSSNDEQYVHVAARLLLFARLSDNEDDSRTPLIVAVIQSLQQYEPPQDSLLFFAKGDTLDEDGFIVIEAFVLPCVQNQGDEFPAIDTRCCYIFSRISSQAQMD